MRNGDIHPYILSVHIRGTQVISQFAVRSEHKDTLHRRFNNASHSRSERGGEKKDPPILSDIELGFPSSYPKYFFLFSWRNFIYPLLTLKLLSILPQWVNKNLIIFCKHYVKIDTLQDGIVVNDLGVSFRGTWFESKTRHRLT